MALFLAAAAARADFRPPAVPLVTSDPFLSIWSESDHLNGSTTKHWTRHDHSLVSLIRIDGKTYRLMGVEPKSASPLAQQSVIVLPTRSIYEFEGAGVHVTMTFMQPALPDDLDVYSWPLSYITWQVRSTDGGEHRVQLYDSTSSQLAVNKTLESVEWSRGTTRDLTFLRVGTRSQPVLGSCGDDHRINWGYAYAAAPKRLSKAAIGDAAGLESKFVEDGSLPVADDPRMPRPVADGQPAMAFAFDFGSIGAEPVQRQVIVAYDEVFAIKYFGKKLLPYWARNGAKIGQILQEASNRYPQLLTRCEEFDRELMEDLTKAGGEKYARIAALAYRECVAANGLAADANKQPLFFTKENTSNGDIATVDVFFPMDPIWIVLSPSLAKASLVHVLMYSASPHWKFPNAPHDLGTYPLVFGRDDGGEGMPVEESGNMLILCDAIAHADGNADFVAPWWPQLTQWAKYLEKYGLDPEQQLCTDDFMGHLAHNANLSVKAILGLAAYGDLCRMRGEMRPPNGISALARADAKHWMKVAADGDHYRLAFDKPHTWSQKYNLVWDRILGLNIFPPAVAQTEVAYYKKAMLRYGVPLDSRTHLTKTDWSVWSATLAEDRADFEAIIAPIYDYLDGTPVRNPIADSYQTDRTDDPHTMHARPVVGGFFIKLLTDGAVWKKWASRDKLKPANWAPLPAVPRLRVLVPLQQNWRFTTVKPGENWTKPDFDTALERRPGRLRHPSAAVRLQHGLDHGRHLAPPHDDHSRGRAPRSAVCRLSRRGRRDLRQRRFRCGGERVHHPLRALGNLPRSACGNETRRERTGRRTLSSNDRRPGHRRGTCGNRAGREDGPRGGLLAAGLSGQARPECRPARHRTLRRQQGRLAGRQGVGKSSGTEAGAAAGRPRSRRQDLGRRNLRSDQGLGRLEARPHGRFLHREAQRPAACRGHGQARARTVPRWRLCKRPRPRRTNRGWPACAFPVRRSGAFRQVSIGSKSPRPGKPSRPGTTPRRALVRRSPSTPRD